MPVPPAYRRVVGVPRLLGNCGFSFWSHLDTTKVNFHRRTSREEPKLRQSAHSYTRLRLPIFSMCSTSMQGLYLKCCHRRRPKQTTQSFSGLSQCKSEQIGYAVLFSHQRSWFKVSKEPRLTFPIYRLFSKTVRSAA